MTETETEGNTQTERQIDRQSTRQMPERCLKQNQVNSPGLLTALAHIASQVNQFILLHSKGILG